MSSVHFIGCISIALIVLVAADINLDKFLDVFDATDTVGDTTEGNQRTQAMLENEQDHGNEVYEPGQPTTSPWSPLLHDNVDSKLDYEPLSNDERLVIEPVPDGDLGDQ